MENSNLIIAIFEQIESIPEYDKVCASFNYLIKNGLISDSPFLRMVSLIKFKQLISVKDGN